MMIVMAIRILVVTPWARNDGGAEVILWNILTHLNRERATVSLAVLEQGPLVGEARASGMRVDVHKAGRLRHPVSFVSTVRFLARQIDEQRPDVVIDWHAMTHLYGAAAQRLARHRPKVVWWQHMIPDGHWVDRIATALPSDAVGAWSRAAAEAQRMTRPQRSTFVVHPGTSDPGVVTAQERAALRDELGIPEGRQVVTIVGRLQPWKGQDQFLEALAKLRAGGADLHGLVVGGAAFGRSVDYARDLPHYARRCGIEDRVSFIGQVDDVSPYMRASDVLVNASAAEPFGNVLIEGMSHGVAVVAVAAGGPLEIIEAGVSGVFARSASADDLAAAIARLLDDESFRGEVARGGRERFVNAFGADKMAERFTDEAERLVQGDSARAHDIPRSGRRAHP
jgi:glycosyltransferase involved in cell wall biosynthesis